MKNLLVLVVAMFLIAACSQEKEELMGEKKDLSMVEAQKKFAQLLSSAVSENEEVRDFLKQEAIEQFDNDYDVFYPLIKNKKVSGDNTFRDILRSYSKDEEEFNQIENQLLLLTIYVPDFSLFWDFNAEKWDTSNDEVAVLCRDDKDNTVYEKGEVIGNLPMDEIPGFPCLVIKNNERMKISGVETRSGEVIYEFADEAFDGSKRITTRHSTNDMMMEVDTGIYVHKSAIQPEVIKAWKELKDVKSACTRDYIYYGLTKSETSGTLNRNIREKLYRFKIDVNTLFRIADETKDPSCKGAYTIYKRKATKEEILRELWTDGKFEFVFTSYVATDKGTAPMEHKLTFTVNAQEIFLVKKVNYYHRNSNAFRSSKNTYRVDVNDIESKWVYPKAIEQVDDVLALPWDLYGAAMTLHLFVQEVDDSQTIEETRNVVSVFANKVDVAGEITGELETGIKGSLKLGYGFSKTETVSSTTKITTTVGSDDLGTLTFFFYDPIIRGEVKPNYYQLYQVNNGSVTVALLPTYVDR